MFRMSLLFTVIVVAASPLGMTATATASGFLGIDLQTPHLDLQTPHLDLQTPHLDLQTPHLDLPNIPSIDPFAELRKEYDRLAAQAAKNLQLTYGSNANEVRSNLARDGWQVIYGKELDYVEYQKFTVATAASIASGDPQPVLLYLQTLLDEMRGAFLRSGSQEMRRLAQRLEAEMANGLNQAVVQGKPVVLRLPTMEVEIGVATYTHWKKVSGNYPKIDKGKVSMGYIEQTIPLPNTFQPYVRFRVAPVRLMNVR